MIRIRMAYLHDDQFMALQVDHVSLELLCDHQLVRNLSGNPAPKPQGASGEAFRASPQPCRALRRHGRLEAFSPHVVDIFSALLLANVKNGLRGQSQHLKSFGDYDADTLHCQTPSRSVS